MNKYISNTLFAALWMLFSISIFHLTAVQADDIADPQAMVKAATDKMFQSLKDNKAELKENPDLIFGLVEEIVMPDFDFNKMAKLVLGKNWKKASSSQRTEFTEQFRLLLVRTYSTAMLEYADKEIRFLPFRDDVKKKRVKVPMEIIQSGGPSIPMALSMYLNKQSEWKVYDVKIDGISLVTNYRSSFSTKIRNKGMDALIDSLVAKNEKMAQ